MAHRSSPDPPQTDVSSPSLTLEHLERLEQLNRELLAETNRLAKSLQAEQCLREGLEEFLASTDNASLLVSEDFQIKLLTPAVRRLLGLDDTVLGRAIADVECELLKFNLIAELQEVQRSVMPTSRDLWTADGRCVLRKLLPHIRKDQGLAGVIISFEDVTTHREASDELNRRTRRLELAWEAARGGIFEHRVPIDDSTYVSEQWAQVLGFRLDQLPPAKELLTWLSQQAHPDDREMWEHTYHDVLDGKVNRYSIELRFRHREGHWIWVRKIGKVLLCDEQGRASHMLRMMIDITDLKQVEASLKESEERFRTLASNISQLAWMAEGHGLPFWFNRRWYEYTGTTPEEMAGSGWHAVHHPDYLDKVVEKFRRCIDSGTLWEDTFPLRGTDGKYRWFLSRAIPIRDEAGKVIRWFGTNTDVTHLREVEDRLVEADRQKDEFLAMLGHELRNPLAAIRTASELVKVGAEQNEALLKAGQVLDRQTSHMAKLLDGLLDVSRIIRGKIRLEPEVLDLGLACHEVTHDIKGSIGPRRLDIYAHVPERPVWVLADRVRLAQIINNLLGNAVKFTPDGGSIALTLRQEEGKAVVRVCDSGMGIGADLLPHVFEIFRQSAQSIDRAHGGLGLGLALVKTLVSLHGGTIEATSEGAGHGAEFVLTLPLSPNSPLASQKVAQVTSGRLRLVLIEDNEDSSAMLKELLERYGHEVSVASRGVEGIAMVQTLRPDAVLCDLGLPGMSGLEVARVLRSDPSLADVRLIAISGYGRPEDKLHSNDAGFDAHLTKPLDLHVVKQVLHDLCAADSGGR